MCYWLNLVDSSILYIIYKRSVPRGALPFVIATHPLSSTWNVILGKEFLIRRVADVALSREINFLLEGVRLGLSQKKIPSG